MDIQRARRLIVVAALTTLALVVRPEPSITFANSAQAHTPGNRAAESFDQLYARGQKLNGAMRTLTANFTETTTSSLLVRPLVARGTVAVERPSRVVLRYSEPEPRVVLIDKNAMTLTWPARSSLNIGSTMGRVQKYFVDGSLADLRRQFDIEHRPPTADSRLYHVTMVPKQKRIRETLAKLDLWVDYESDLLSSMRLTFANNDTKTMDFDSVVSNPALPAGTFTLPK